MDRPFKVRHRPSGRVRSYSSFDAAMARLAMVGALPERFHDEYEFIDADGKAYDAPPILKTMRTLARIYDIGSEFVGSSR